MSVAVGKQERTYAVLRQRIIDSTYLPGHRLVIDAIARELDVSPMPVREAIRRLEAEGWVVYHRNQGARVAPIDSAAWTEAMSTLAVLEGYCTALAAPHVRPVDLERLRALDVAMGEAVDSFDVLAISQRNRDFHQTICDRCPNGHLRRELRATQERFNALRSTIFMFIPTRGRASIAEHERLLRMIERGSDPLEVELAAREHKMHTVAAYVDQLHAEEPRS